VDPEQRQAAFGKDVSECPGLGGSAGNPCAKRAMAQREAEALSCQAGIKLRQTDDLCS
jgi:hypothetical protein